MVQIPVEHDEQTSFVLEIGYKYRMDDTFVSALFGSIPNGAFLGGKTPGQRAAQMAKLKAEGLNTGMADIIYLQPRGTFPYLAIEMKRINAMNHKDMDLSEEQMLFREAALAAGAFYATACGADDAIRVFSTYMELPVRKPTGRGDMTSYEHKVFKQG